MPLQKRLCKWHFGYFFVFCLHRDVSDKEYAIFQLMVEYGQKKISISKKEESSSLFGIIYFACFMRHSNANVATRLNSFGILLNVLTCQWQKKSEFAAIITASCESRRDSTDRFIVATT